MIYTAAQRKRIEEYVQKFRKLQQLRAEIGYLQHDLSELGQEILLDRNSELPPRFIFDFKGEKYIFDVVDSQSKLSASPKQLLISPIDEM